VFYRNGHAADYRGFSGGVYFCDWGQGDPVDNVVKNNIFLDNKGGTFTTDAVSTEQVIVNNWEEGDPLFVDIASSYGPFVPNLPDFRLKAQSPCIDSGTYLTTITSASGSGTQFVVEDPGYFTDGWGMIDGDEIQLAGSDQKARIAGVDYGSNTITVDRAITWTKDAGISLAYAGSAPDLGAHEFGAGNPVDLGPRLRAGNGASARVTVLRLTPSGAISIDVSMHTHVKLRILDLRGRTVANLTEGSFGPGRHTIRSDDLSRIARAFRLLEINYRGGTESVPLVW
jgi:hypothetical protein